MSLRIAFVALVLSACHPPATVPDNPPPPPIPQDATTVDGQALGPCDSFCQRARQLKCKEGDPTDPDEQGRRFQCEDWCLNAAEKGVDLAGPVSCTSPAQDCNVLRKCIAED